MNTFCEHHKNSIKFAYRCFDRILLNGLIQPFQQPERVIGFFNAYREGKRITRNCLRDIAEQFQNWVRNRCQKWDVPILDAPEGRRDDLLIPTLSTPRTIRWWSSSKPGNRPGSSSPSAQKTAGICSWRSAGLCSTTF